MFAQYKVLQKKIKLEYKEFNSKYPLLFSILEVAIRNKVVTRDLFVQRCMSNITSSKFLLVGHFYTIYISLFLRENKKKSIFIDLRHYNDLTRAIKGFYKQKGWDTFKAPKKHIKNVGSFGNIRLIFKALLNIKVITELQKNNFDISSMSNGKLEKIEASLKVKVDLIFIILKKLNIKKLFLLEDQEPQTRLLIEAAKKLNIDIIVFAHGYIQDPYLISIAPFHCSHFFTWSESNKKDLIEVNACNDIKINHFGLLRKKVGEFKGASVLFVAEPFVSGAEANPRLLNKILELLKEVKNNGFKVVIRLHPMDLLSDDVTNRCLQNKISVSDNLLYDDLANAFFVIGTNSSVLFEASQNSIPTFQIEEYAKCSFDGVTQVSHHLLIDLIKERFQGRIAPSQDDLMSRIYGALENLDEERLSEI